MCLIMAFLACHTDSCHTAGPNREVRGPVHGAERRAAPCSSSRRRVLPRGGTQTYHVHFRHHVDAGDVYAHAHVHGGACGQMRLLVSGTGSRLSATHGCSFTSKIRPQTDVVTLQQLVHRGFHVRHVAGFVCAETSREVRETHALRPGWNKKALISPLRAAHHRHQQRPAAEPAAPPVRHGNPHPRSSCRARAPQLGLQKCYSEQQRMRALVLTNI